MTVSSGSATCRNCAASPPSKNYSATAASGNRITRLRKELRALMGDTISNYWEGE
jgi:hypothetical protein